MKRKIVQVAKTTKRPRQTLCTTPFFDLIGEDIELKILSFLYDSSTGRRSISIYPTTALMTKRSWLIRAFAKWGDKFFVHTRHWKLFGNGVIDCGQYTEAIAVTFLKAVRDRGAFNYNGTQRPVYSLRLIIKYLTVVKNAQDHYDEPSDHIERYYNRGFTRLLTDVIADYSLRELSVHSFVELFNLLQ